MCVTFTMPAIFAALPTRYGRVDFYSVAAQVMPLLLLTILFEQRALRRRNLPPLIAAVGSAVVVGVFIVGEGVALKALYLGYAHRQDQVFVIGAMLIGAVVLLLPVIVQPMIELERRGRSVQSAAAVATVTFVLIVVGTLVRVLLR